MTADPAPRPGTHRPASHPAGRALPLSSRDLAVLDLERSWFLEDEPKEALVRERLGLEPAAYYRLLNRLIDRPAALAHDPLLVRRLRRLRAARRAGGRSWVGGRDGC